MKRSQFFKTLFGGALGVAAAGKVVAVQKPVSLSLGTVSGVGTLGSNRSVTFEIAPGINRHVDIDAPTMAGMKEGEELVLFGRDNVMIRFNNAKYQGWTGTKWVDFN